MAETFETVDEIVTISEAEDPVVLCRTLGHSWDENPHYELETTYNYLLALRCTRCTTERFDFLSYNGELASRMYRYPHRYKMGRVYRQDLRREMIKRRLWVLKKGGK